MVATLRPTLHRSGARRTPVRSATRDSAGASACGGTARRSCGASQPRPAPPPPPRPPPAHHAPARRGGLPHASLPGGTCRPRSPAPPRPSRRSRPRQSRPRQHRRQRWPLPGTAGAEGRRDMPSAQRHAARRANCGLAKSRWQQRHCVPQGTQKIQANRARASTPALVYSIQARQEACLANPSLFSEVQDKLQRVYKAVAVATRSKLGFKVPPFKECAQHEPWLPPQIEILAKSLLGRLLEEKGWHKLGNSYLSAPFMDGASADGKVHTSAMISFDAMISSSVELLVNLSIGLYCKWKRPHADVQS